MLFEFISWVDGTEVDIAVNDEAIAWVRRAPMGKTLIAFSGKEAEVICIEKPYEEVLAALRCEDVGVGPF